MTPEAGAEEAKEEEAAMFPFPVLSTGFWDCLPRRLPDSRCLADALVLIEAEVHIFIL